MRLPGRRRNSWTYIYGGITMKSHKPADGRSRQRLVLWLGLMMTALLAATVAAQTGVGTVTGTIRDTSHSAIANADVTITNPSTGVSRSGKSTGEGSFYFGGLT